MFFLIVYILFHFSYLSDSLNLIESIGHDERNIPSQSLVQQPIVQNEKEIPQEPSTNATNEVLYAVDRQRGTHGTDLYNRTTHTIGNPFHSSHYHLQPQTSFNRGLNPRGSYDFAALNQNGPLTHFDNTYESTQTPKEYSNTVYNNTGLKWDVWPRIQEEKVNPYPSEAPSAPLQANHNDLSYHSSTLIYPNPSSTNVPSFLHNAIATPDKPHRTSLYPDQSDDCPHSEKSIVFFVTFRNNLDGSVSNRVIDMMEVEYSKRLLESVSVFAITEYFEFFATHQSTSNNGKQFSICLNVIDNTKVEYGLDCLSICSGVPYESKNFYLYLDSNEDFFALKVKESHNMQIYHNYLAPSNGIFLLFEYKRTSNGYLLFSCFPSIIISPKMRAKMEKNEKLRDLFDKNEESNHNKVDMEIAERLINLFGPSRTREKHYPNLNWSKNCLFYLKNEFEIQREKFEDLNKMFTNMILYGDISQICKNYPENTRLEQCYVRIDLPFLSTGIFYFTDDHFDRENNFANKYLMKAETPFPTQQIWIKKSIQDFLMKKLYLYSIFNTVLDKENDLLFPLQIKTDFTPYALKQLLPPKRNVIVTKSGRNVGEFCAFFRIKEFENCLYLVLSYHLWFVHLLKTCFVARNHDNKLILYYRKGDLGELWFSFTKYDKGSKKTRQEMANRKYIVEFAGDNGQFQKDLDTAFYYYEKYLGNYVEDNDIIMTPKDKPVQRSIQKEVNKKRNKSSINKHLA